MSCQLTLAQLQAIAQPIADNLHPLDADKLATGIVTDTRCLQLGEVFVALRGENFDGHEFVPSAIARGATGLIVDRLLDIETEIPQFQVEDTLKVYQKIARWWRDRFSIPVVGITGSVGKTTTKELMAAVLGTQGNVHKTKKNYNNEIGVPKTLLELAPEHDYAVIEMAMRASGEIADLTQIARPTIGVITNVGTAHIGRLGSREAIACAKCELLAEMPEVSVAILNHDNPLLLQTAAGVWQGETITYGLEGGDICGQLIEGDRLQVDGVTLPLPLPGRHNALNYLAVLAVAKVLGIDWQNLTTGLKVDLPGGRSRRYDLPGNIVVLDETYNAGLESTIASLHLLKETPAQRHLAVLGTMKELGEMSAALHRQVGETANRLQLDGLFVLVDEPETEEIASGAKDMPKECFRDRNRLLERLKEEVKSGDAIVFKASNSVGLSQVVEQFCASLAPEQFATGS